MFTDILAIDILHITLQKIDKTHVIDCLRVLTRLFFLELRKLELRVCQ